MDGRTVCWKCWRPEKVCYCDDLRVFQPQTKFVIVSHPKEARRRTSTGRMLHRSLRNSVFVNQLNPDECPRLQVAVNDPTFHTVLLYPARNAINLDVGGSLPFSSRRLQIVVIDATWAQAKKMYRFSSLLQSLPTVAFESPGYSQFKIRTQPAEHCLSTIESVARILELLDDGSLEQREGLLFPFRQMVRKQIEFQVTHNPNHPRKWENP